MKNTDTFLFAHFIEDRLGIKGLVNPTSIVSTDSVLIFYIMKDIVKEAVGLLGLYQRTTMLVTCSDFTARIIIFVPHTQIIVPMIKKTAEF